MTKTEEINDGVLVIMQLCHTAEKFLDYLMQGKQAAADIQQQQITQDGIDRFGEWASKLLVLFKQPESKASIIPMIIQMLKKQPQQSPDSDPEPQPTAPEETTQPKEKQSEASQE
jgi:hypothetical protein